MKPKYQYRFKNKKEFEKEFGENWREKVYLQFPSFMDKLFGQEYPFDIKEKNKYRELHSYMGYHISWDMLIENEPLIPNYKPKQKIIRQL